MDRPNIEQFLELCKKKTPGNWGFEKGKIERRDPRPAIISYVDEFGEWINGDISNLDDASFIAAAGTYAESIAQYALLMEKAFENITELGDNCPYDENKTVGCFNPELKCPDCVKEWALHKAERQLKEENK